MNEFLVEANRLAANEKIALLLYETLVNSFGIKNLNVEANLYKSYGLVDDELDQVVIEIAKRANLKLPSVAETAEMKSVVTVKDLLLFLDQLKKN